MTLVRIVLIALLILAIPALEARWYTPQFWAIMAAIMYLAWPLGEDDVG